MENLGLTELDKKWFEFTSKYVEKLKQAKQNWDSLSEKEQELAALWKLEMDMYNGGFIQFFCNWGFDCYTNAVRCLERLNARETLDIIQQQYKIIERLEDDERIEELWDISKYLTDEEAEKLDDLDQLYWDNSDHIIEKTFETYMDMQ